MAYRRIRATATLLRDYLSSQVAPDQRVADIADLIDNAIRWTILQQFPAITTIKHKNDEDFGDNIVWYFGPPGDVAAEIRPSFAQALQLLQDQRDATVARACDLLTAMITQEALGQEYVPAPAAPHAPATAARPDRAAAPTRWLTRLLVIAAIDALLLFTLVGVLIAHGIIIVPAIVNSVVVVAIVATVIGSRALRRSHARAASDAGE